MQWPSRSRKLQAVVRQDSPWDERRYAEHAATMEVVPDWRSGRMADVIDVEPPDLLPAGVELRVITTEDGRWISRAA